MKKFVIGLSLLMLFAGVATADEDAMKRAIGRYQDAFNKRDVSTIESLWSETAVLEDATAQTKLMGRETIMGQLKEVFAQDSPPKLSISTDSVTVRDDGAMLVSGMNTLTANDSDESFAFTALIQSIDGKWQITRLTESSLDDGFGQSPRPSPLQSIEWLIGVWSASGDDAAVVNEFRYMPGNGFIVRTFAGNDKATQGSLGYQVIGAIPGSSQLRSWTFLGDGSVSQAEWIVEEERILIESKGRLADAAEAAGTYVLRSVDENTMTMKVVGHTINGEPVPSKGTVTLTRQINSQEPQQ